VRWRELYYQDLIGQAMSDELGPRRAAIGHERKFSAQNRTAVKRSSALSH
jgi:hypothetical protein